MQIAAGELFLVELYKLAGAHRLMAKLLELLLRAVYPDDFCRLAQCGHLIDPLGNVFIIGKIHNDTSVHC